MDVDWIKQLKQNGSDADYLQVRRSKVNGKSRTLVKCGRGVGLGS